MRVLILSASIGMGHVRAGNAIEKEMRSQAESVRHEDALNFANAPFRNLYRKAYFDLVANAPELLGLAYEYSDKEWKNLHHGMAFERLNIQKLIGMVEGFSPDVVISTHSLPADMISWLLCKKKISCKHVVVLTDFDVHPVWLCHHYSRYFVPLEETKEHLVALGLEKRRVVVTGIPIDPVFAQMKDKRQMRIKHNLDPDRRTILISAGGLGMGPVEELLCELMRLPGENQIVTVCGSNSELKISTDTFAQKVSRFDGNLIKVVGYTDEMDEYMSASDLILGKCGGLTSSEALAKGLVFVIVSPVPGQEERNADHLLEEGAAIRCNNLPVLSYKIENLLGNKERLQAMRSNALKLGKPDAARQIADEVISLMEKDGICATYPRTHVCEG